MLRLFMVMCKVALFIYILILFKKWRKKKKKADIVDDVAQLEHNDNKCYISAFRYI